MQALTHLPTDSTAPVGSAVYSASATAAIGMILAAKDDNLPDCVTMPEKKEIPEEEMVEVEVTDETPAPDLLFAPDEFGEAVEKPKKEKKRKVKVPKPKGESKPGFLSVFWNTIEDTAMKIYDKANEE